MPSIFLSLTISAMAVIHCALFTWYGQFGNDDPVAPVPALGLLDGGNSADDDPALPGGIDIPDTLDAHHDAAGREVRAGHDPDEVVNR